MATYPDIPEFSLDIREQIARIDRTQAELSRIQAELNKWQTDSMKVRAETAKVEQDTRFAPYIVAFTGLGAGAALFAAGVAFAKLLVG